MQQVGYAVVDRRGGHQEDLATHNVPGQRTVPVGVGVSEPVRFVDDDKCGGRAVGRSGGHHTERFVCDDRRFLHAEAIQQRAPLRDQNGRDDQSERLAPGEGNRERDVRLAQSHFIREQRTAVARDDRAQPLGGGDLVRRQPGRPCRCAWRHRRPVEQRPRCAGDDALGRRFARPLRREGDGEGFRNRNELLRENPRPARGGRRHRVGTRRLRDRQRARSVLRAA